MASMLCAALLLVGAPASATSAAPAQKRVMLWTTTSAAGTNATVMKQFLADLATVKDIVDVVSPCSYYIQQVPPHGLLKLDGADVVHKALQDAGFKVQPLVGDKSGGWNMSWYRETFKDPAFAAKAVEEIKAGKLEGLNFDYEPHQPGNLEDAVAYAAMVDGVAAASGSQTTMDFPCDGDLCDVASLTKNPKGGKLLDMSTYGGGTTAAWTKDLHGHIAAIGLQRYGMGVCPSCSKGLTAAQVAERMAAAEAARVIEIDFWAGVNPDDPDSKMWWDALRKWKATPLR